MAKKCPETKKIVPEIVPKKKKIYLHEKCPKVSRNIPDNVPYFKPKMTVFAIRKMFSEEKHPKKKKKHFSIIVQRKKDLGRRSVFYLQQQYP